jgi:hypothetical protein
MALRQKSRSRLINIAQSRAVALAAINPPVNLGETLSLTAFETRIADAREQLNRYNSIMASAEEARVVFEAAEKALGHYNARMLAAVAAVYGKESEYYATAGGTLLRNRKRPYRKTASDNATLPNAA